MSRLPTVGQQSLFHSYRPEALQVEECTIPGCDVHHGIRGPCFNCRIAQREAAAQNGAAAIPNTTPARKQSVYAQQ